MKKLLLSVLATGLILSGCTKTEEEAPGRVVASYVTSWSSVMPDPTLLTHINYAFGHVNDTFNGVRIDNVGRLKSIVALKSKNPQLKVVLSIGGWESGRFSEMAENPQFRESFAKDCARLVKELNLDGIDIDWEYPGEGEAAGISYSVNDKGNYTLLMRDLRSALGKSSLLTLASCCDPKYIDFTEVMEYVDFVNLMTYDMGNKQQFHCALYSSSRTGWWTADKSVKAHVAAGVPIDRIVMGVPFYGKGSVIPSRGNDFREIYPLDPGVQELWDDDAKAPYLADEDGNFQFGFENEKSLTIKCDHIRQNGLLGIMNWDYAGDDDNLTLTKIMHSLMID